MIPGRAEASPCAPAPVTLLRFRGVGRYTVFVGIRHELLDCGPSTKTWRSLLMLTPSACGPVLPVPALGRTAAERVHCAPHQQPPQRVPGTATDFSNWEQGVGSVASMVNRPHSRTACAVITSRAWNLPMTTRWSRPTAVARRRCGASRRGKKRRRRWLAPTWRCKNKAETRWPQAAGGAFRVYGGRQPAADPLATGGGGR